MTLSRRRMLRELMGLSALLAFASACKTRLQKPPRRTLTPLLPSLNPSGEDLKAKSNLANQNPYRLNSSGSADCEAKSIIDTSKIPPAGENLTPTIKVYGDSLSGMLILGLSKFQYVNGGLQDILILRENGKLICHKRIEESDIAPDTTIIPIIFDNIALKGEKKITVLFKTACESCSSGVWYSKFEQIIKFETMFNDKPVVSITPTQFNPGYAVDPVYLAVVGTSDSFEHVDSENVLAKSTSTFTVDGFKDGDKLTDLLGAPFDLSALNKKLTQHPEFIVYRPVNSGANYVRTFIRVY